MSPTEKAGIVAGALIGAIAALAVLRWLATLGDKKWAKRREQQRLATRYTPPLNARPNDFDLKGRPW